ncbi:MAG: PKD domain-containing protein [Bacteroidia bacterium]
MKTLLLFTLLFIFTVTSAVACPVVSITTPDEVCEADSLLLSADLTEAATLVWFTEGDGTFGNAGLTEIIYIPSLTERQNGTFRVGVYTEHSDTCQVSSDTVTFTILPAPDGSFSASPTSGDAPLSVDFTSNVNMGTDTGTYVWYFGDGDSSLNIEHPSKIYQVDGSYTVTLRITNEEMCTDTIVRENYIQVGPVGISEINESQIRVFPNPAQDAVWIRGSESQEISQLRVLNMHGQIMLEQTAGTVGDVQLNVGNLPRGIFILNLTMNNGDIVSKRLFIE